MEFTSMPKYVHKKLPYRKQDQYLKDLCAVIQKLSSAKEKRFFLKDLLTRGERVMITRRFKIAQLLYNGWIYRDIMDEMGVGKDTIARVERALNFGRGGYMNAIKKALTLKKRI